MLKVTTINIKYKTKNTNINNKIINKINYSI